LLVPPGDWNGFSEAITRLLSEQDLREHLGQQARRLAIEQHSWSEYIKQLEAIYHRAL
jgi:glycosyltransferase involved in cell wall biosynthesis